MILWQNATVITKRDNNTKCVDTMPESIDIIYLTIYFWMKKESN